MFNAIGAVFPHGSGLIPGFTERGDASEFERLRQAAEKASKLILGGDPETIIIATPHNLRIRGYIGIVNSENCSGKISSGKRVFKVSVSTDRELAEKIYEESLRKKLRVVLVNYGTDSGPLSCIPLDWGTIVPLYFLGTSKKIVLLTPSRELPWRSLVNFGKVVRSVADSMGRRTVFIASADQAHAHLKDGPYGYDEAAKIYDQYVNNYIRKSKLGLLLELPKQLIERAKPDSLWQMLILHGFMSKDRYKVSFSYYGRPSYYGMIVATFV